MRHSRCEREHPLRNERPVSPMTPNRTLNRTLSQHFQETTLRYGVGRFFETVSQCLRGT